MLDPYEAFISYRNSEAGGRDWAEWLHQELERYDIPPSLVGKTNQFGVPVPERIYPIFRDLESLPSAPNLSKTILENIEASNSLIVVCSPASATSPWVEKEVAAFKKTDKGERIISVLVAGKFDPANQEYDCLPPGILTDSSGEPIEPLVADLRPEQQEINIVSPSGYEDYLRLEHPELDETEIVQRISRYADQLRKMLLRIIAGVLGIQLDELTRRDLEWRRRKSRSAHTAAERQFRMGRWADGITDLGRALQIDPENPEPGWHLWSAVLWGKGERETLPDAAWTLPAPSVALAVHAASQTPYVLGTDGRVHWLPGGTSKWQSLRVSDSAQRVTTVLPRMSFDPTGSFLLILSDNLFGAVLVRDEVGTLALDGTFKYMMSDACWSCGNLVWRDSSEAISVRKPARNSQEQLIPMLDEDEVILSIAAGKPLLVTHDNRGVAHVYNYESKERIASWQMDSPPYAGMLSPDGSVLLLRDLRETWSWRDPLTGRELTGRLESFEGEHLPQFSPKGELIALPGPAEEMFIYDRYQRLRKPLPFGGAWTSYAFGRDARRRPVFWGLPDEMTLLSCHPFSSPKQNPRFRICFESAAQIPLRSGEYTHLADGHLRAVTPDGQLTPPLGSAYKQTAGHRLLFSPDGEAIAVVTRRVMADLEEEKESPAPATEPSLLKGAEVVSHLSPDGQPPLPSPEWRPLSLSHPKHAALKLAEYGGRVRLLYGEEARPVAEPFMEEGEFLLPGWTPDGKTLVAQCLIGETFPNTSDRSIHQIRPLRFLPWPEAPAKGEWVQWFVEALSGWDISPGKERQLSFAERHERREWLAKAAEPGTPGNRPPEEWCRLIRWWNSGGEDWNAITPVPDVPVQLLLRPSTGSARTRSFLPTALVKKHSEYGIPLPVAPMAASNLSVAIRRDWKSRSVLVTLAILGLLISIATAVPILQQTESSNLPWYLPFALPAIILASLGIWFAKRNLARRRIKQLLNQFVEQPSDRIHLDKLADRIYRTHPNDRIVLRFYVTYLDWSDQNDLAFQRLAEQADVVEANHEFIAQLAWSAVCAMSPEEGRLWVQKASDKGIVSDTFTDTMAWLAYREGDYPRAWATLSSVEHAASDHPEIGYHAGMILNALDRPEEAVNYLFKATRHPQPFAGKAHAQVILEQLSEH